MPMYEYKCRDCGTTFEKIVPSSTSTVVCRNCESPQVDKLLSVFAVASSSHSTASPEAGPCATCGAECAADTNKA